ncbi:hypothetical protein KQY30_24940 [Streptomyces sp. GMY02]|uniref:hypothetical protein n=1 Tax=Streptomyces sp. GMY02 TaxID=1333528 RepID=UPI001C2BE8A7|nr:hypothetical protein [Streptomyces sp. GMY02]QXE36973.1 hypothetical protein KQY30_24940 [Streptomyces sp. GMY02]
MYRAKDTFWAPLNRRIVKGDLVAAHDPVVEGRESLFEAVVIPQALSPQPADGGTGPENQEPQDPGTDSDPAAGSDPDQTGPVAEPQDEPLAPAAAKKSAARKTTAAKKPQGGDA